MTLGLLLPGAAAAEDLVKQAASDFEVPTFTSQQIAIEGQDLLAITGSAYNAVADGQLAVSYTRVAQTPQQTLTIGESTTIYATTGGSHDLTLAAEGVGAVQIERYLFGSRGLGLTGGLAAGAAQVANDDPLADIFLSGGVSYGRIVDARTLAQAQAMYEVLDREPTLEQLVAVAELIGRRAAYTAEYQYDADIHFYNDISEALGWVGQAEIYRIQQVLDSALYNIGSRVTGWTLGGRADLGAGNLLDQGGAISALSQYAAFATLMGRGTSLTLSETVTHGLSDSGASQVLTQVISTVPGSTSLTVAAALSVDHSSSWSSSATGSFTATAGLPPDEDGTGSETAAWEAAAQSNLAVGSKLVAGGEFTIGQTILQNDLAWGLNLRITYFVL